MSRLVSRGYIGSVAAERQMLRRECRRVLHYVVFSICRCQSVACYVGAFYTVHDLADPGAALRGRPSPSWSSQTPTPGLKQVKIVIVVPGGFDRSGRERVIPALLWLTERLARRN